MAMADVVSQIAIVYYQGTQLLRVKRIGQTQRKYHAGVAIDAGVIAADDSLLNVHSLAGRRTAAAFAAHGAPY